MSTPNCVNFEDCGNVSTYEAEVTGREENGAIIGEPTVIHMCASCVLASLGDLANASSSVVVESNVVLTPTEGGDDAA